ncbi:hypothetical protein FRC07_002736 [Ceratobasidium sp. 392]|nr:hypothetical protein FRC07_002736 [Ceratobasidium sp. 392]
MATVFYKLSAAQVVSLSTIHTVLQGSFAPLLVSFLSSTRSSSRWFKAYVVSVHIVALGQTIMHITQVFDLVESRQPLPLAVYHMKSLTIDTAYQLRVVFSMWILSSFVLDLCMTTTTMVYLYRSRTGLGEHDGAFSAIWQITWASAAPPLILMTAIIIEARGVSGAEAVLRAYTH